MFANPSFLKVSVRKALNHSLSWMTSGTLYLPVFSPNAGKMGTRITPNVDTFYVVISINSFHKFVIFSPFSPIQDGAAEKVPLPVFPL